MASRDYWENKKNDVLLAGVFAFPATNKEAEISGRSISPSSQDMDYQAQHAHAFRAR